MERGDGCGETGHGKQCQRPAIQALHRAISLHRRKDGGRSRLSLLSAPPQSHAIQLKFSTNPAGCSIRINAQYRLRDRCRGMNTTAGPTGLTLSLDLHP
jgi:hypothetical protein